jgi:hypothetical protein
MLCFSVAARSKEQKDEKREIKTRIKKRESKKQKKKKQHRKFIFSDLIQHSEFMKLTR